MAGTSIQFEDYTLVLFGLALVLMMLFRREGFIPEARVRLIMNEEEFADVSEVHDDTKVVHHHG